MASLHRRVQTLVPRLARPALRHEPHMASPEVRHVVLARSRRIATAAGSLHLGQVHHRLMLDTWQRTLHPGPDGVFVVTGDIPAMWLRDSSAQMRPWVPLAAESPEIAETLAAVVRMQWRLVLHDPYANAFNRGPVGGTHHLLDNHVWQRGADPWVWERKYEVDSLAFPILLADQLWQATGSSTHLDELVRQGMGEVLRVWRTEQHHESSDYRFVRLPAILGRRRQDTLARGGRGTPVAPTGMTWQGFRPSDDATVHGYNIPGNLMAAHVLRLAARWADELWTDLELARQCRELSAEITAGVESFGLLPDGSFAYEVDGLGGVLAADDANMPSLLSLPLVAGIAPDDERYLRTRERILSPANPWWHSGRSASGIGSPHTPGNRVWPIALAVQGLTSLDAEERLRIARRLLDLAGPRARMCESFHADDPSDITRLWFSWADMMWCELLAELTP